MPIIALDYVDTLDGKNEKKVLKFSKSLLPKHVNEKSLFVVKVDGKSMQPVIKDRTLVIADLSKRIPENQKIYLIYYSNRLWIKQAKKETYGMTFVSINKEFSHLCYKEEEVRVIARVVLSFNTF